MGLILCKTRESETPYTIKHVGQNIYSLEELSYYIYNNVYLIGSDLIDESLIKFIGEELGEEKLANNLTTLIQRRTPLSDQIVCILRYVDFYSYAEIMELKKIIDSMSSKHILERIAARADALLKNNCCYRAIENYERIIADKDASLSDMFYGKVYHNLGVAFARLFLYEKACECFEKAYEITNMDESKNQSVAAALLFRQQNGKDLMSISDEDRFVVGHEIEMAMNDAPGSAGYAPLKEAFECEREGDVHRYYELIDETLTRYENQYIDMCK